MIALPNGTLIYYLWASLAKAQNLLNAKTCNHALEYLKANAKDDNIFGPGVYASANPYDSSEFGEVLLELHVPPIAKDLISYPRPGHDNVVWYFTRTLNFLEFFPFSGQGMSDGDLQALLFSFPWGDTPDKGQLFIDRALWMAYADQDKEYLLQTNRPIKHIRSFFQSGSRLGKNLVVKGSLLLHNLSYAKRVIVYYTTDHWHTKNQVFASYAGTENVSNQEIWSYSLLSSQSTGFDLEIYFTYENVENGEIFYESKNGENFNLTNFKEVPFRY